ncbi:hypothetical protein H8K33_15510 [Undibacterium amnicola]|uniref:Phytanoyl-CoA dioxygenase n=1 Tax=Undibacterium amnicola TaxID=1834038 RepID=A0ABR6XTT5_9BURK|nr:hypothetical protein [Undibacterium amnicola]
MPDRDTLLQLVDTILSPDRHASSLFKEVNALADALTNLGQYVRHPDDDIAKGETRTEQGLALSPHAAALCARDFVRTVQFMRGVYQAVCTQNLRESARPVNLLYVGCGPYALLALPLMLRLTPQQVQISLIDIHADSIDSVLRIVGYLGLQEFVAETAVADAFMYRIERKWSPDIILLEVMQSSLEKEPQIALSRSLMKQAPDALLIPEEVEVSLCLLNPAREFSVQEVDRNDQQTLRDRISLGTLIRVNRQSIRSWENISGMNLPAACVQIPEKIPQGYSPMLMTTIQVYQENVLNTYDSGLTYPRRLNADFSAGDTLCFSYVLGEHPKLVVDVRHVVDIEPVNRPQ